MLKKLDPSLTHQNKFKWVNNFNVSNKIIKARSKHVIDFFNNDISPKAITERITSTK